jgi:hypothetical protein
MKNAKTGGKKPTKAAAKRAKAPAVAKSAAKRDPRKVAPPTAPESVAVKAAQAIAPVAAVATAEPKQAADRARSKAGEAAPDEGKAKPWSAAAVTPAAPQTTAALGAVLEAGAEQARAAYARTQESGESLRQAVAASTAATTRGVVEINGKMLELIQAQGEATLDLWRSTLTAASLSDAVRAQTSGVRRAYEATVAHWRDIAETTGRVLGEAAKPLRSALTHNR